MNIACNSAVVFVAAEAAPPHYTQLHTTATGAVTSSFRPSFVRRILLPDYGKMTLALPGAAPVTHSLTHPPSLPVSPSVSQSVSQSVSKSVCLRACAWFPSRWRWQWRRHTAAPCACTTYTHLRHDDDPSAEFVAALPSPFSFNIIPSALFLTRQLIIHFPDKFTIRSRTSIH